MSDEEEIFEFPCRFPVKAIGPDHPEFAKHVIEIVEMHAGKIIPADIKAQPSSKGKYVSVTVTFTATSRAQLDAIYQALTDSEKIQVVL